ncbi:cyclohexanone monooxygenase [Frankineae bacterium MT45]|nr:cyclohexanone monooxygenase [Frankineae bacterium MT45]
MTAHSQLAADPATTPRHVRVLIVGSGFAGLGTAIRLTQRGDRDYLVIERGSEVGGTWRDNTYPGAACDVPSHLYSFSFELNPNWSRSFSPQPEIQQYLRATAKKYRVLNNMLFNTEVNSSNWDSETNTWIVETSNGTFTADVLVSASGALCEPSLPDIKGIETFTGDFFHSARWNHDISLEGKRVAVIGTGASAIQIVPEVAKVAGRLDVYQRTAPWIMPRSDRPYSSVERQMFKRLPITQRIARSSIYWARELIVLGMAKNPKLLNVPQRIAERHIARQVKNADLRKKVTPTWQIGCKRILISNTWYPALQRENVELITDGIAEVRPNAIVSRDGTVREVDAIILATGFHVTDPPIADAVKGPDGTTLGEVWRTSGQQAYKGTAVAGFPNLFFLVGPNTGLGHSSMVYMIESQINYLLSALDTMRKHDLATVEVRKDKQDAFNKSVQKKMSKSVWTTGGCASWYLDAHGNNTTLWSSFTFSFRAITRNFDLAAYRSTAHNDRRALTSVKDAS